MSKKNIIYFQTVLTAVFQAPINNKQNILPDKIVLPAIKKVHI